ncbi:hypothetical protein MLD38_007667 [Melastoma candidum]|uniref:Uncharacterized protein n=1 Tax=Melastoma candidum TaxID=119954 RepID=A0ACB9RUV4_9MYRT|nr:hypothetical protein MLD38_007667 [Melastoma candidum]
MMKRKYLSSAANDVVARCAMKLGASADGLIEEFEDERSPDTLGYSRRFVEFCCSKVVRQMCSEIGECLGEEPFSRFTFDMMLAWENPEQADKDRSTEESIGKEKEDRKMVANLPKELDDVSLFYSDIMPLLVDHGPDVGEDAFLWMASLFPLVADVINAKFSFESLTATIGNRLHYPAYDKYLKEIDRCIQHLRKQEAPKGVVLAYDEIILHIDGTTNTSRVVRHMGGTSRPGRLTLTNYALYFEASGVISYEDAIKIDLSRDTDHNIKPGATGPFGAPLFDKAIEYDSPDVTEEIVLEFPELTSSTRRELWLALSKEVMLMHKFIHRNKLESPFTVWEIHSRTILGIVRLHSVREMLRMGPPLPTKFLMFSLFDELPKGDIVLEQLAESLKDCSRRPCHASSIMNAVKQSRIVFPDTEVKEDRKGCPCPPAPTISNDNYFSLNTAVNQVREETKVREIARATAKRLKEESVVDNILILLELLNPIKEVFPKIQEIFSWQRPMTTLPVAALTILVIYKEWVNKAVAALLVWLVVMMHQTRKRRVSRRRDDEVMVCTASDKSMAESIVSAQHSLQTVQELIREINIAILKLRSIYVSTARKHSDMVMLMLSLSAAMVAVIPLKYIFMAVALRCFIATSEIGKHLENERGKRRMKEWWDSIPASQVRVIDRAEDCPLRDAAPRFNT